MSKLKIFLILLGYQITWILCIFGEFFYNTYAPGFFFGLFFVLMSFYYSINKKKFIFIIILLSTPGYLFDSILVYFEIYNFETSLHFGFLPIWMIVLWPSFATLFDEVFTFLTKYKIIAVILSSILGPLTYYSGSPLSIIVINQLFSFFILMMSFWILLMLYYLNFLLKFKFD